MPRTVGRRNLAGPTVVHPREHRATEPRPTHDDDLDAIARVLAGDREAFGAVVARYARRVHDLARRMLGDSFEAEDVAQQTFLNAFRALAAFDPRRPFRHWLLRIATNQCRNRLAARRTRATAVGFGGARSLDVDESEPADREPDAGFPDEDRLRSEAVRAAIDALPDRYRPAVVLHYTQGLSLEEVSEVTGEPVATVKTHLHRGRAALRRLLAGGDSRPPDVESRPAGETGGAHGGTTSWR